MICLLFSAFALILAISYWETCHPVLRTSKISLDSLPEKLNGFRILLISDLHANFYGNRFLKLVEGAACDCICITGDLIHKKQARDIGYAKEVLRVCAEKSPTFFVEGNHEAINPVYEQKLKNHLSALHIPVLENKGVVPFNGFPLYIYGVKCWKYDFGEYQPGDCFSVILTHRPDIYSLCAQQGADLILAGHTHGGQVQFFGRGLFSTGQGIFPKYSKGLYRDFSTPMFVTAGVGNHSKWIPRIFNSPGIDLLILSGKEGN